MSSLAVALIVVVGLFVCVIAGVHIGFSLALMSVLGIVLMSGNIDSGLYILGTTSFEALRSYSFAVIPHSRAIQVQAIRVHFTSG